MLHQIGVGVLGPVFRTYEPGRDRLVAVKMFRLDLTPERAHGLADVLQQVADRNLFHRSIVTPIAAGVEGAIPYLAEEYVAAESLDVAMRHYAPAPFDRALPFLAQLAGAIDFARAAGIGHGALHPRDIFVTPDEARATGFGVAEALEGIGVRPPVRRPYSAPERIAGEPWGAPADVYALAAIAHELLTGRRAAGTGEEIAELDEPALEPPAVRDVLIAALSRDPGRRHASALAFVAALEAAASGKAAAAAAARSWPPEAQHGEKEDEGGADRLRQNYGGPPKLHAEAEALRYGDAGEDEPGAEASRYRDLGEDEDGAEIRHYGDVDADIFEAVPERTREIEGREIHEVADAEVEQHAPAPQPAAASLFDLVETGEPQPDEPVRQVERRMRPRLDDRYRNLALDDPDSGPAIPTDPSDTSDAEEAAEHASLSLASSGTRRRFRVVPAVVVVLAGFLAAFVAGYIVGSREDRQQRAPETAGAEERADARDWSEEPVAGPAVQAPGVRSGPPPAAAPSIPAETIASPDPRLETPAASEPRRAAGSEGRIELAPDIAGPGRLLIRSSPAGAQVTVNGRPRGQTPLVLRDLPLERYTVHVSLAGYAPETREIALSESRPAVSETFGLIEAGAPPPAPVPQVSPVPAAPQTARPAVGPVFVDSQPRGARVLLNGRLVGTTPMRIPEVPVGPQRLQLDLEGYRAWATAVRVVTGEEVRVTARLEPDR